MFSSIKGQEAVGRLFKGLIEKKRLAHSYLFIGPDGVGKFLFARTLARVLLCEKGCGCNSCKACKQVEHLTHPALMVIEVPEGKKNIPIENVRELEREIALKPFIPLKRDESMGNHKIFIINNADLLSEDAAHALLKTLEEPPPHSLLILVSARPERLPVTVRSRCHYVRFHPLPREMLVSIFRKQLNLAENDARVLGMVSDGSVGTGVKLFEGAFLRQGDKLAEGLLRGSGAVIEEVLRFARQGNNPIEEVRQRIILQFKMLAFFLRDALFIRHQAAEYLINPDKISLAELIKNRLSTRELEKRIDNLLRAEQYLKMNLNINVVVANALLN